MLITKEQIEKFDNILDRGLCTGIGTKDGQMCIEAAISVALDLPFNDNPRCVGSAVRAYKIKINDSHHWKDSKSRAKHLRNLGIAQLGSNIIDQIEFSKKLAKATIQILIPQLYREIFPGKYKDIIKRCELEGSKEAAKAAYAAAAAAANSEKYLILSVNICLNVLKEMNCPGIAYL